MKSKAHLQAFYSALQSPGEVARITAAGRIKPGTETASDQLLASNRERQKRNTCSAAAFQAVHYKSCCFLQVLVFLFS